MIRQSTLYAVHQSADALTQSAMLLTPVAGSPLDELYQLSLPPEALGIGKPFESAGEFQDIINASMARDFAGQVPHDEAMQRAVDLTARIVSNNIDLARNQANPMIKRVAENAHAYADQRARGRMSPLSVVPVHVPAPYNSPILGELVSRYSSVPSNDMKLGPVFPPMAPAQIREYCLTGITRLDEEVKSWLGQVSDEFIENLYNDVFGHKAATLTEALADRNSRAERALMVFLLARRFFEEIPDGLNMSLPAYKEYVSGLMNQAGVQVVNAIRRRADNDKLNYLIISSPYASSVYGDVPEGNVYVNGDVWVRYVKEGGTPEALFGALHKGGDVLYNDLLAKKDQHEDTWKRAVSILRTKAEVDRFNYFLEGMRQALLSELAQLPEHLRTVADPTYKARITEHLAKVKEGGKDEPWVIARKLVCRVFFPNTEVESVLWAMATQCKINPDLDVREAALLATIEIVAQWVAKQFTVAKTPIDNL